MVGRRLRQEKYAQFPLISSGITTPGSVFSMRLLVSACADRADGGEMLAKDRGQDKEMEQYAISCRRNVKQRSCICVSCQTTIGEQKMRACAVTLGRSVPTCLGSYPGLRNTN